MGRLFAIGDVHGESRKLRQLLKMLELQPDDTVVMLGDYIDRGPDSPGVIETLRTLVQRYPNTQILLGNHEELATQSLEGGAEASEIWLSNGGKETLQQYRATGRPSRLDEDLAWLNSIGKLFYDTSDYAFVHAGLNDYKTVAEQLYCDNPNRSIMLWSRAGAHNTMGLWEKTVVTGHQPGPEPIIRGRYICIDTAACKPGRPLTAIELPSHQITQAH